MGWLWRLARRVALAAVLVLLTLIVGGALDARWRLPDLKAWHRVRLDDVRASTLNDTFTVPQYLAREEQLFAQVRAFESTIEAAERTPVNRYIRAACRIPRAPDAIGTDRSRPSRR